MKSKQKKENKQKAKNSTNANTKNKKKVIITKYLPDISKFTPINNRVSAVTTFMRERRRRVREYIESILDPQIAVETGKLIKQPSMMPIFSTTVSFRNEFTITTDTNGEFYVAWNPNFLNSSDFMPKNTLTDTDASIHKMNYVSHLAQKYDAGNTHTLQYWAGYIPSVSMSKYRLVSAKMNIAYVGPRIEKAGLMYACATYDPTPLVYTEATGANMPYGDNGQLVSYLAYGANSSMFMTYEALTEANIANGLWNRKINVQASNNSISCIHIPTDPTSKIFNPMGSYFGEVPNYNNRTATTSIPGNLAFVPTINDNSVEGTQVCYLACGKGLPQTKTCINITIYYNFEIIPTTKTAPFLRNTMSSSFSPNESKFIEETISAIDPSISSIRIENSANSKSGLNISSLIKDFKDAYKVGQDIHSFFKKDL